MNPTAGSFTINPRLQRHFATFSVVFPGADALFTIYNSILSDYLESPVNKFSLPVRKLVGSIVNATIQLHTKYGNLYLILFTATLPNEGVRWYSIRQQSSSTTSSIFGT